MIALIVIIGVSLASTLVFGGVLSKAFLGSIREERPPFPEPSSGGGLIARIWAKILPQARRVRGLLRGRLVFSSGIADAVSRFVPMAEGAREKTETGSCTPASR